MATLKGTFTTKQGDVLYPTTSGDKILSGDATAGQVLTADGNGNASWQDANGGTTLNKYIFRLSSSNNSITTRKKLYNILVNAKHIECILFLTSMTAVTYYTDSTMSAAFMSCIFAHSGGCGIFKFSLTSEGTFSSEQHTITVGENTSDTRTTGITPDFKVVYWNETEL